MQRMHKSKNDKNLINMTKNGRKNRQKHKKMKEQDIWHLINGRYFAKMKVDFGEHTLPFTNSMC